MTDEAAGPDERTFRDHVERATFRAGVSHGRWRLIEVDWPSALIEVAAVARKSSPTSFILRFELSNYPASGPTAGLWDPATGNYVVADKRPKGHRQTLAFRADWERGEALYLPCDRRAIADHGGWAPQARGMLWTADADITAYLLVVSDLLTGDDYEGV
jgi:hypothetical protein